MVELQGIITEEQAFDQLESTSMKLSSVSPNFPTQVTYFGEDKNLTLNSRSSGGGSGSRSHLSKSVHNSQAQPSVRFQDKPGVLSRRNENLPAHPNFFQPTSSNPKQSVLNSARIAQGLLFTEPKEIIAPSANTLDSHR